MHPLNSPSYLREVIRPAVAAGAASVGRDLAAIDFCINPFFVTGETEEEFAAAKGLIRKHLAFYAATRTYSAVLAHHGWQEVGEMLDTFAIVGRMDELPGKLAARYGGMVSSVNVVFGPPYADLQARQRDLFVRLGRVLPALQSLS